MKVKIQVFAVLIVSGIICPLSSFGQDECDPFFDPLCLPVPLDNGVIWLLVAGLFLWYWIGKTQVREYGKVNPA
jgi:hypothetical protein